MGTRSITIFRDDAFEQPGPVVAMVYRQFDGYPTGMGEELKKLVGTAEIINGIRHGQKIPIHFNGMGCLAAWAIGELKDGIGGIYMTAEDPRGKDDTWVEYVYELSGAPGKPVHLKLSTPNGGVLYDDLLGIADMASIEAQDNDEDN